MADRGDKKGFFREWLETLQQESWQLELLISGFALFGIFEAKNLLEELTNFVSVQFFSNQVSFIIALFMFILRGSWYIFVINLLLHIIMRGLWIGAIGLRYVSEDIDYEQLRFSTYFDKLYKRRYKSFDDYIEDLERICSVIFAYTFLLFFLLVSACMFMLWPMLFIRVTNETYFGFIILFYVLIAFIVFIDFIFLNPLKKIEGKWFNRIYGSIFRFYSTITLSFLFRPLLLNFLDNKFTKRLFLFSIPYAAIIILVLPRLVSDGHGYFPTLGQGGAEARAYNAVSFNPQIYDNLRKEVGGEEIKHISLDSDIIQGGFLKFFLTMIKGDVQYFEKVKDLEPLHKEGFYLRKNRLKAESEELDSLSAIHTGRIVEVIQEKKENYDKYSEREWDRIVEDVRTKNNKEIFDFHKSKVLSITQSMLESNQFYLDGLPMNNLLICKFSKHPNRGERGWMCYLPMDSLENGLHELQIDRIDYSSKSGSLNSFRLEIPFILDTNQN